MAVGTKNCKIMLPTGNFSTNVPSIHWFDENGNMKSIKEVYTFVNGERKLCWQKSDIPPVAEPNLVLGNQTGVLIGYTPTVDQVITKAVVYNNGNQWASNTKCFCMDGETNTVLSIGSLSITSNVKIYNLTDACRFTSTFADGITLTAGKTYYFFIGCLYSAVYNYYDENKITETNYRRISLEWMIPNVNKGDVIADSTIPSTVYTDKSYYIEVS